MARLSQGAQRFGKRRFRSTGRSLLDERCQGRSGRKKHVCLPQRSLRVARKNGRSPCLEAPALIEAQMAGADARAVRQSPVCPTASGQPRQARGLRVCISNRILSVKREGLFIQTETVCSGYTDKKADRNAPSSQARPDNSTLPTPAGGRVFLHSSFQLPPQPSTPAAPEERAPGR